MSLGAIIRERREAFNLTQDRVAEQASISKPYLSNIETGRAKNPPTDGVLGALERVLKFEPGELTKLAHLVRTPLDVREEYEQKDAQIQKLRSVLKGLLESAPRNEGGSVDLDAVAAELDPDASGNVRALTAGASVPIINKVTAGYPRQFTDLDYPPSVADEYIRCPDLHDAQAFAARVVGDSMEPSYREGDIVIFSPNTPAQPGDDCFIRFAEDAGTTFKRVYRDEERSIRLQPLNSRYAPEVYPREQVTGLWPAVFRVERLGAGQR
jgi:phage repressor protein C with HTH and peptisase S24 domain